MEVICLEEPAFYALVDEVVGRLKDKFNIKEDKWIPSEEAMRRLGITSKTTLQSLRDNGSIRFTQPSKKVILYDSPSIDEYLERHARETF